MDAFLLYVDDWLSSKRIDEMDAAEERGYLRLLLHAAKEPDCGLPMDPKRLARWSRLGPQWDRETKEKDLQFGATSGEKLMACFEIRRDGRMYNKRLLAVWEKHKEISAKRQQAACKRYANAPANGDVMQHVSTCTSAASLIIGQTHEHGNEQIAAASEEPSTFLQSSSDPPGRWGQSLAAMRTRFPDADQRLCNLVAEASCAVRPGLEDSDLAVAIHKTFRRNQFSPGLWLQTVPALLRKSEPVPIRGSSCALCGGAGRVLRADTLRNPDWLNLPETELYEPCECNRREISQRSPGRQELPAVAGQKGVS